MIKLKSFSSLLLIFVFCLTLSAVELDNGLVHLVVDDSTGIWTLGDSDGRSLIDGYPSEFAGTHFAVNYNGTIRTNVPGTAYSLLLLEESIIWEDTYITTQWRYDDLLIWQKLRFIESDSLSQFLSVEVMVYNEGTDSSIIGIQFFGDMNINGNDNPVVATPADFITRETMYTEPMVGYWVGYENIEEHDSTKLMAMGVPYGRSMLMPDLLIFADSDELSQITWDFDIGGGSIDDMAFLLRWNEVSVHPTSFYFFEFNYGLPYPNFDEIEESEFIAPEEICLTTYPNPFNGAVKINLGRSSSNASIDIFDINGKHIENIENGNILSENTYTWLPGNDVPTGVYLISYTDNDVKTYQKVIYLK